VGDAPPGGLPGLGPATLRGMGRTQHIVIIGGGPRGLSVLERLAAHVAAEPGRRVDAHVVDPFPPGPGHVWRTDQSRHFLMNTPSLFPTVVPTQATVASAPGFPEPIPMLRDLSFERWRAETAAAPDHALVGLSDEDLAELRALTRAGFPSRKIYGTYLADVYARIRAGAPRGLGVTHHPQEAVRLSPADAQSSRRYRVELGDGVVLSADAVVLALGHTDATLHDDQRDLMEFAAARDLGYWPPAVPADVHWDDLPAGERVLIRGMGLNFHDVLARLTEGRGGGFEPDPERPHRLVYRPSGLEPQVWVASRRGTPYRAKAVLDAYYPRTVENRFFTRELVDRTRAQAQAAGRQIDFETEYWPLMRRDAQWNYYRTMVRVSPESVAGDAEQFLREVDEAMRDADHLSWWTRLERLTAERIDPQLILRPERLTRPFGGQSFQSHEEYAAAVVHLLDRDVEASFAGEDSPLKMAIGSLNRARALAKYAVQDHGVSGESWVRGLERMFASLVDGLASGPPVLRIQQMAALARAGTLRFLGPDPVFGPDEREGSFVASSPWVRDEPVHAESLVEALAPANDVRISTSPLIRRLFEDGYARPWQWSMDDSAAPVPGRGFEVTASPYRLIGPSGEAARHVYVLGLQLSSAQWGTAIAAEADADLRFSAQTLANADDVVADVLGGAA
jgi:hypothetical protein